MEDFNIKELNEKWKELQKTKFLCYENCELASLVISKLFDKDIFNDVATYFRKVNNNIQNGYTYKVLSNINNNLYFQFDIVIRYGVDIPTRVCNGKFRYLKKIPNGWQDIDNELALLD